MKPVTVAVIAVVALAGYVTVRNATHHPAPKAVQVIKKAAPLPPVVVAKPVPAQPAQAKPHEPTPRKARPAAQRIAKPLAVVPPAPRPPVAEGYGGRLLGHPVERDRQ